jgi:glycerate kinase
MKIVVAFDKFKGSLTAPRACEIVRAALQTARPELQVVVKPLADGGDGTAEVLQSALGGEWIFQRVTGPLQAMPATGKFVWISDRKWAVIEMAAASGLMLLRPEHRNPLRTTTHGTGELIAAAAKQDAQKILIGVGGSATVDGGVGAAMALGWRFFASNGRRIGQGGGELEQIARIEAPTDSKLPEMEILCDVNNPLCGEQGAARVFGPQKGATPEMVERLDAGLRHLADVVREQLGKDLPDVPGAGAAGGLGFGAMAFMNAKLVPGIDTVMAASGLPEALTGANWVITGEGCFDIQSLRGKVVAGVTRMARNLGVKVAVIAGSASVPKTKDISVLLTLHRKGMALEDAIANAEKLLAERARELAVQL